MWGAIFVAVVALLYMHTRLKVKLEINLQESILKGFKKAEKECINMRL